MRRGSSRGGSSVTGVAKRGSRLFSTFSPTILYEAMALGRKLATTTKKNANTLK
jgi:hypothetical protein